MSSKSDFIPHVVRLLIEAAGENVALTIVQQLGGSRLRIPKRAEGTRLEKLVGTDAARALVDSLADERLEIPLANRFVNRSEEHTSELQSLMRISYAVFCLQKKKKSL